jgi:hypothetical protein
MEIFLQPDFQLFPPDYKYGLYYLIILILISIVSIYIDQMMERNEYKQKKTFTRILMAIIILFAVYLSYGPIYFA